jgi:hypothetical protein
MSRDAWNSHNWLEPRSVKVDSAKPLVQFHCSRCCRDFVQDPATGKQYAVHVSVFEFRKLPDSINQQWLGEMCPGAPMPFDLAVRDKLVDQHAK